MNIGNDNKHSDFRTIELHKITPFQQMMSSCTGAFITSIFVTPLDVVKIRLQAQQKVSAGNKCFLYCNGFIEELCCTMHAHGTPNFTSSYWYSPSRHFSGTMDTFFKIARTEGVSSLWSGLPPTLVMAVPATVVYFTLYDQLQTKLRHSFSSSQQLIWIPAVAGGIARAIAVSLISPLEFIRTKRQSKKLSYTELCNAMRCLVETQGLHSLWRGLGPTLLRDIPFSSLYWTNYELLKRRFKQQNPTFWFSFTAGAASGVIAAVLTLPFDVIKTHRQIELGDFNILYGKRQSTYFLMKNLYQRNGYKALFAGIVPRVIKIAPACAIMISTYEYGKSFFFKYNKSKYAANFL